VLLLLLVLFLIFADAVGIKETDQLTDYGDELSGWWVLWKRWNPFNSTPGKMGSFVMRFTGG
jgi:hypothetical protein